MLVGCASNIDRIRGILGIPTTPKTDVRGSHLNPIYRYLRVTINGRTVFVTLGDIDNHPDGPVEVYYSSSLEVVRLQNGRIFGVTGLLSEWRNVSLHDAPNWAAASQAKTPVAWSRVRDLMPGYRYGITDQLALSVIAPPRSSQLLDIDPTKLTWFEEKFQHTAEPHWLPSLSAYSSETLPPARYAVDFSDNRESVVYGEQCIAQNLCFAWQRWTLPKP